MEGIEYMDYDYVNPTHYHKYPREVIDIMVAIWGPEKVATYCEIAAFKYRMRLGDKPNEPVDREVSKIKWYEDKAVELRNNG